MTVDEQGFIMRKLCILLISLLWAISFYGMPETNDNEINLQLQILKKDPNNLHALKKIGMLYLYNADFKNAIYYGSHLQELAYTPPINEYYCLHSHIILGEAYTMGGKKRLAYDNLFQAKALALSLKKDSALASVYNGIGLYYTNLNRDYYSSLTNLFDGLKATKRSNYKKLYSIILSNIATVYYLKNDTVGLQYALECYHQGLRDKDIILQRNGLISAASIYYLKHNYPKALQYIKESEKIELANHLNDLEEVYTIYASTLSALNRYKEAEKYYKKALSYNYSETTSPDLKIYCEYAQMLIDLKRYSEALPILKEGEDLIKKTKTFIWKDKFYHTFSLYYERIGQYQKALDYHKLFQAEHDSIFNANKENALNDIQVKYKTSRLEADINKANLDKVEKERKIELMGAVIVCILAIVIVLFYLYHRKNKLYLAIVKQNQLSLSREKSLENQIEELKKPLILLQQNPKYTGSSLTNEKGMALFDRLEALMRDEHVYTDNMLSREKVADMLGTNRTYLSQIINEQTSKTFTQYVNDFRTREAIKQLSDLTNDIPLKALSAELGFNSMTTFYHLFQSMVGMTPAQYRTNVQELNKH